MDRQTLLSMMPDLRSPEVRARIAAQMANLDPEEEAEALRWIEAVSDFDLSGGDDAGGMIDEGLNPPMPR